MGDTNALLSDIYSNLPRYRPKTMIILMWQRKTMKTQTRASNDDRWTDGKSDLRT